MTHYSCSSCGLQLLTVCRAHTSQVSTSAFIQVNRSSFCNTTVNGIGSVHLNIPRKVSVYIRVGMIPRPYRVGECPLLPYDSPKTPEYEKIGPTRILPHLYIGCLKDALSEEVRKKHHITHILNVSTHCERPADIADEHFMRIPVNDGYIDDLHPYFDSAHQFINRVKAEQGKVMVHCQAGMSRSAALTISYIMKSRMIRCEQAYRFVKMMRPIVAPNFNFLGQLLEYEKELNLTASPTSAAGTKRKRLDMSLPLSDRSSVTDSPQHTKRLVVDNNNSISSLSPASALAGLKFEHSISSANASCPLPGPSAAEESTVVEMRNPAHQLLIYLLLNAATAGMDSLTWHQVAIARLVPPLILSLQN
ncbi:DUSP16 [Bugula neritina]|uniref:protein-tyrosine-phosphatase n=1 Tax=Bugula neritina TaxID=10212 RepID=A0A7J7K9Y0_BUGNE|nr:DUSP16 [Bugula neritina]